MLSWLEYIVSYFLKPKSKDKKTPTIKVSAATLFYFVIIYTAV